MTKTHLAVSGPYDLGEIALMGFGHRDERSFDGVTRMAFCLDGDYDRQVGVEARQQDDRVELLLQSAAEPVSDAEVGDPAPTGRASHSLDQDGEAFHQLCVADPGAVEGPRCRAGIPAGDFYSRYQAAVWSIISARRARQQGIPMRKRPSEANGVGFDLAGERTLAVATPSRLLAVEAVPGLPADGPTPPGSPS